MRGPATSSRAAAVLAVSALLHAVSGFTSAAFAAPPGGASSGAPPREAPPAAQLDEVVVTGERPGPGLWRVHRGSAEVWILGSMSPLPKGITWRSKQVETILDHTREVLVQKPIDIGIARILWLLITQRELLLLTGGKRLHDVLPAPLHERFAAQRAKFTDDPKKWERYRPLVAAAFLQQAAFHQVGLSTRVDLGAAMRNLAEKHHVALDEVKIAGARDLIDALKTLPPAAENICVQASLSVVEHGLPRLVDRAEAWANGNIERIEQLAEPPEVDACRAAVDTDKGAADLISRVRATWMGAIEQQIRAGGTSMAVINIDMLIEQGGLLDQLRERGYEVEAPGTPR